MVTQEQKYTGGTKIQETSSQEYAGDTILLTELQKRGNIITKLTYTRNDPETIYDHGRKSQCDWANGAARIIENEPSLTEQKPTNSAEKQNPCIREPIRGHSGTKIQRGNQNTETSPREYAGDAILLMELQNMKTL